MSQKGRNKLATTLSQEELEAFLQQCCKTRGLTLAKLQKMAAKLGISISHSSAAAFKKDTLARYIEKAERVKSMSAQIQDLMTQQEGRTLADAASGLLSQEVFEHLVQNGVKLSEKDGRQVAEVMARILQRLRQGDQRQRELEMKVAEFEREAEERERRKKEMQQRLHKEAAAGGISASALQQLEQDLRMF